MQHCLVLSPAEFKKMVDHHKDILSFFITNSDDSNVTSVLSVIEPGKN